MVDRRTYLSDIEKLYYLVGCCKGVELDAIRGILVSDKNYKLAWSTLEERFDKPRLVARSLVEKLLSASFFRKPNRVEQIVGNLRRRCVAARVPEHT